jgi:hypothetical protein
VTTPAPSREPLPCPFCGSAPLVEEEAETDYPTRVFCVTDDCTIYGYEMSPAAWNRRAPLPPETSQ